MTAKKRGRPTGTYSTIIKYIHSLELNQQVVFYNTTANIMSTAIRRYKMYYNSDKEFICHSETPNVRVIRIK